MNIKKTANLLLNFAIKRLAEIFGIIVMVSGLLLLLSLLTYSPEDPNFIFPDNTQIINILGFHGSFISDLFIQSFGLVAYLIPFTFVITGINIFRNKNFLLFNKSRIISYEEYINIKCPPKFVIKTLDFLSRKTMLSIRKIKKYQESK